MQLLLIMAQKQCFFLFFHGLHRTKIPVSKLWFSQMLWKLPWYYKHSIYNSLIYVYITKTFYALQQWEKCHLNIITFFFSTGVHHPQKLTYHSYVQNEIEKLLCSSDVLIAKNINYIYLCLLLLYRKHNFVIIFLYQFCFSLSHLNVKESCVRLA